MLGKIMERFRIRYFRQKMMIASIACILLPAVFSLLIYNNLTQNAVRKQAIQNSEESLLLVKGYVTNLLNSMLSIANYVQMNVDMNSSFKLMAIGDGGEVDPYQRFKQEYSISQQLEDLAAVGEKRYVTVLLTNGTVFKSYSSDEYDPRDIVQEPWFGKVQGLQGLQSYWTTAVPTVFASEKKKNPYQISVVRTLRGTSTHIYGYVIVTVMENQLNQIFSHKAQNREIMIVDGANRILSHRDPAKIGEPAAYADLTGDKTSDVIPIAGGDYLVSETTLPFTGWRLVAIQPYKEAIVNINSIFHNVFVFQLASFLLFLLLFLYLTRRFTHPLIRLGKVAAAVQRGNLLVRSNVRSQDEIGRLGYSFDQMLDKINDMINEVSIVHSRKRKAELAMLQAQIKPHFLFNVLNSIRMKVLLRGDQENADMIESLSKLLRMTVSQEQDSTPLGDEIGLISHYVRLMNMRQREKTQLDVNVSPAALLIEVPRFSLQPIIENALIHGLNRCAGTIAITARIEYGSLLLSVADNGVGMDEQQLESLRGKLTQEAAPDSAGQSAKGQFSGIGLPNVYERMNMMFGADFRMDVRSKPEEGTQIVMVIPCKEALPHV